MTTDRSTVDQCARLMQAFAGRTGLDGDGDASRRYLWTDAHAVCNFLSLADATGDDRYRELAARLVDRVHVELGRHRADDTRRGRISGLDEDQGRRHPTAGGLRIGKPLNERAPDADYDPVREWDQDGQYFHYLTKWMHALSRMFAVTGNSDYLRQAIELAVAAYRGFLVRDARTGREFLAWKMRIDLSEPLVPAAGLHDPLDGYITCLELGFRAEKADGAADPGGLDSATAGLEDMLENEYPPTDDPLGIGGMLSDALRLAQLIEAGYSGQDRLLAAIVSSARSGLDRFAASDSLRQPPERRLAFREFGLSIGLHANRLMRDLADRSSESINRPVAADLSGLERHEPLAASIEQFWSESSSQSGRTWQEHRDINAVMLATSLLPGEFLQV